MITMFDVTLMLLLGTVGVLMVLAAHLLSRRTT